MKHTEKELSAIKDEVGQMWRLVISQLDKCREAYVGGDRQLAREVLSREKRVNTFELKVESDCENYIALFSPVAIDLRLILSLIKISGALERIGDFAKAIATHVLADECSIPTEELVEKLQTAQMFDTVIGMLSDALVAMEAENTRLSGRIMQKDQEVDEIYRKAIATLAAYVADNPGNAYRAMETMLVVRKIERIGDHCVNLVEEIVFYIDAKILKHSKNREEC